MIKSIFLVVVGVGLWLLEMILRRKFRKEHPSVATDEQSELDVIRSSMGL